MMILLSFITSQNGTTDSDGVKFKIESFHFKSTHPVESVVYAPTSKIYHCILGLSEPNNGRRLVDINDVNNSIFYYNAGETVFKDNFGKSNINIAKDESSKRAFFEDEKYFVDAASAGEYGGAVYFLDKKSKKEYIARVQSPTVINKLQNTYYVTASQVHLDGGTMVYQIADPAKLEEYSGPHEIIKNGEQVQNLLKAKMGKSSQSAILLGMAKGMFPITAFIYQKKLYHILTDRKETFVAEIFRDSYNKITSISNTPWKGAINAASRQDMQDGGDLNVSLIDYEGGSGLLAIRNNVIKCYLVSERKRSVFD